MIRYAVQDDFQLLAGVDRHIGPDELKNCIDLRRVLVMFSGEAFVGWLRYGLFWDNLPFLNMLYFLEGYRGRGFGAQLVRFWEQEMSELGFEMVLASTLSSENGQHFFRKNGYVDCGALLLPGEPAELILRKTLISRETER